MIKNRANKTVTFRNAIVVDDIDVKYQEITIESGNPKYITITDYFAGDNAKSIYKDNREEVRRLEAEFEDMAYLEQEKMIAEAEVKVNEIIK